MEELERERDMPFEGRKVAEAVKEIMAQGPAAIDHIIEQEVDPFIKDVETLATSMANLYQEHAAHFLVLGVKVNIEVQVMGDAAFESQVGANVYDDNDVNRVHKDAEAHKDAVTPVQ